MCWLPLIGIVKNITYVHNLIIINMKVGADYGRSSLTVSFQVAKMKDPNAKENMCCWGF